MGAKGRKIWNGPALTHNRRVTHRDSDAQLTADQPPQNSEEALTELNECIALFSPAAWRCYCVGSLPR
jgi:hypothetical protein